MGLRACTTRRCPLSGCRRCLRCRLALCLRTCVRDGPALSVERSKCSRVCRRLSRVRNCILYRKRIRLITAAARKALQDSLQDDEGEEDDDEQRYLNMNEEEGDVWDDK